MYTGFAKCKVIACNPTGKTLEELCGEEMPDPVYLEDGRLTLDIWLRDADDHIFKHTIILADKQITSKTGKLLYINCVGDTQWVENEGQLWDSFKHFEELKWENGKVASRKVIGNKEYHVARRGEPELVHYQRMLTGQNVKDETVNFFFDFDRLMEGDVIELLQGMNQRDEYEFLALMYVEDNVQKVWKEFLPCAYLKYINTGLSFDKYTKPMWDKYLKNLESINGYSLTKLIPWDPKYIKAKKEITSDLDDY